MEEKLCNGVERNSFLKNESLSKLYLFFFIDCFFLSDHNLISNEVNLIIIFVFQKVKKSRVKNESENLLFIYTFSEQRFYITRKPNLS